jgi:glucosamine-6-phosphate deaminase
MTVFNVRNLIKVLIIVAGSMTASHAAQQNSLGAIRKVFIFKEDEQQQLYEAVADRLIKIIHLNPKAIILLPTGSTPLKFYQQVVQKFKADPSLDFSKATFFNLDEYVGLEEGHPLSYQYYMDVNFYGPLRAIDPRRAPQKAHCFLPTVLPGETSNQAAVRYGDTLKKAIASSQGKAIDLAFLGIGGAYPDTDKEGRPCLKGGHIAFNEPGTSVDSSTRMVVLSEKTRLDTAFRFSSLRAFLKEGTVKGTYTTEVPKQAISLGLADIMKAKEIVVMATSEDKAPVIEHVFLHKESDNFPASHLHQHSKTSWYLDEAAATRVREKQKNTHEISEDLPLLLKEKAASDQLPQNKTILVISPHPDDDVICMSATLQKLLSRGNKVHIVYAVSGSNAVRETDQIYKEIYPDFQKQHPHLSPSDLSLLVKEKVREVEAIKATSVLGLKPEDLTFFKAHYYKRRGIPGVQPLQEDDISKMSQLLRQIRPDIVFFAAENDPHGAHGLSTELVASAAQKDKACHNIEFYGYRGAYAEWPLYQAERLIVVPFDEPLMQEKIVAIKAHLSQLDPLFPSFDPRPFWQRAYDRNKQSGTLLKKISGSEFPSYAEVFKRYSFKEFINAYL